MTLEGVRPSTVPLPFDFAQDKLLLRNDSSGCHCEVI